MNTFNLPSWRIIHRAETGSTNVDARDGVPGDVFTADFQTAGKGRLDHRWFSPPKANLIMTAVIGVEGMNPTAVSTLPLVAGVAVLRSLETFLPWHSPQLKWPNDILVLRKKLCGILCERHGDNVLVGIGMNVKKRELPPELENRAVSIGDFRLIPPRVNEVRDGVLDKLRECFAVWAKDGFAAFLPEIEKVDALRGRHVSVWQTDADSSPIAGICGGIAEDGALDVGGVHVYAGEAHVEEIG